MTIEKKEIQRVSAKGKLRYLRSLSGSPEEMMTQVLGKDSVGKSKERAIDTVYEYAQFLGVSVSKPDFRAYDNTETYVPNPEMVRQFPYRIRSIEVRARAIIVIETSASASEVWRSE